MALPLSFPYPSTPFKGYWNDVTSTIDWCEENYVVTPYIAEAMNTISNSIFILLAIYATVSSIRNKLETRFHLISIGFALVGIGSWLFHMTLKYEFQLLDELPMIYATCIPVWSVFSQGVSKKQSIQIAVSVLVGSQLLTVIYLYFKDPTIHQVAYAILNVFIIIRSIVLTQKFVKDDNAKKDLWKTMILGIVTFLTGFILWNLDVHFCNSWIKLRRYVGIPYGFIFELHSWWHILTGTGVYFYLVYLEYLRLFLIGKQDDYIFVKHLGILPEVQLKQKKD